MIELYLIIVTFFSHVKLRKVGLAREGVFHCFVWWFPPILYIRGMFHDNSTRLSGFVFCRKLMWKRFIKAQKKQANITGVQFFRGFWSFAHINRSDGKFVLSFNIFFKFLTICANSPFRLSLRLHQSTVLIFSIACTFQRLLRSLPSIHWPLPSHRYDGPV